MKIRRYITLSVFALLALTFYAFYSIAPSVGAHSDDGDGREGRREGRREIRLAADDDDDELERLRDRVVSNNLNLSNVAGTSLSGTAKVSSRLRANNLYDTAIDARVNGSAGTAKVFEGWLVDNESGYRLSLGGFTSSSRDSRHDLRFRQMLVNFPIYDKLVVTEEAVNDTNPNPGRTIFEASLPGSFFEVNLRATLRGANQIPSVNSRAIGVGRFSLNTRDNTLRFDIRFSGLSSAETSAHIHGPASTTENAGVLFALPSGSPKTGTWNYPESVEADLLRGRTYVNVHSANFPAGEIRGQIVR